VVKEGREGRNVRKVQIWCYIPEDLNDELRQLIQEKYKHYVRGLFSWEVEQAIRHWLAMHKEAQGAKIINRANPRHDVGAVFTQVKRYLLQNYYEELIPGATIPLRHLEEAIMAVRGGDKRTVRKWLELFHRFGLVKPITQAVWELVS
jgi:hypothetical protein